MYIYNMYIKRGPGAGTVFPPSLIQEITTDIINVINNRNRKITNNINNINNIDLNNINNYQHRNLKNKNYNINNKNLKTVSPPKSKMLYTPPIYNISNLIDILGPTMNTIDYYCK